MILGQTPRAPVFSGVRPLFYQVVGSDPEFRKRVYEASDPLLQNAKLFLRAPLDRPAAEALVHAGAMDARVLHPGGRVVPSNGYFGAGTSYPYVPFFPASHALLQQRLPPLASQRAAFESAGLQNIFAGMVVQQIAPNYAAYADKLAVGGDSILASLDPRDLAAGLRAIRAGAADVPVAKPIDFLVFEKR